jgi:hypothetical protein
MFELRELREGGHRKESKIHGFTKEIKIIKRDMSTGAHGQVPTAEETIVQWACGII